jgi:hypothetical protein
VDRDTVAEAYEYVILSCVLEGKNSIQPLIFEPCEAVGSSTSVKLVPDEMAPDTAETTFQV